MQPSSYHDLLEQQLKQMMQDGDTIGPQLHELLQKITASYAAYDTALKAAEDKATLRTEQLIASTSRAYSFLDSIHKGFIMCDTGGEVVLANDSVRKMLTQKSASLEAMEQTVTEALTTEAIDKMLQPDLAFKQLVEQCLRDTLTVEFGAVNFGKLVLQVNIAPLINDSDTEGRQLLGVVVLFEDITAEKLLERSKDEFLSIASHELRTPLTAIRGNASLITKHYADSLTNPDMAEMINDIHEASIRLIAIVNDFLDVAAIEQGKIRMQPEKFSLGGIINEVVHELERMCQAKGVTLQADASVAAAPVVYADKQRIKQVIINLIGNAVKFTDKGSITISTALQDGFVKTVVTDTGRGMSAENQKLLFRKFQQAGTSLLTRDSTKGTGLGLYISKLIVELSGGTIALESSVEGEGSAFAFTLPVPKS